MLSEINQRQKNKYYMTALYRVYRTDKFIEQNRGYWGLGGGGNWELLLNGSTEFQFRIMKNFWKWTVVMYSGGDNYIIL